MVTAARRLAGAWLLAGALAIPAASMAPAQDIPDAKLRDIGRIFEITGMNAMLDGMIGSVVAEQMKTIAVLAPKKIPQAELEAFQRIIVDEFKSSKDDLYKRAAVVYDRHFTHEEILEMIRWYQTPLGRKTIEKMPTLMNELMAAGKAWGEAAGGRAGERMRKRRPGAKP